MVYRGNVTYMYSGVHSSYYKQYEIHKMDHNSPFKPVTYDATSWFKTIGCDKLVGDLCHVSNQVVFVVWI